MFEGYDEYYGPTLTQENDGSYFKVDLEAETDYIDANETDT